MAKRTLILTIVGGAIVVALVVTTVVLFLVLGELQGQAEQEAYENCMARNGHAVDSQAPSFTDPDDPGAREYLEDVVAAAERCANQLGL